MTRRVLTPEEEAKVEAFKDRLTAPPPDTGKEGNEHWLKSPHGAADISRPHLVPIPALASGSGDDAPSASSSPVKTGAAPDEPPKAFLDFARRLWEGRSHA